MLFACGAYVTPTHHVSVALNPFRFRWPAAGRGPVGRPALRDRADQLRRKGHRRLGQALSHEHPRDLHERQYPQVWLQVQRVRGLLLTPPGSLPGRFVGMASQPGERARFGLVV